LYSNHNNPPKSQYYYFEADSGRLTEIVGVDDVSLIAAQSVQDDCLCIITPYSVVFWNTRSHAIVARYKFSTFNDIKAKEQGKISFYQSIFMGDEIWVLGSSPSVKEKHTYLEIFDLKGNMVGEKLIERESFATFGNYLVVADRTVVFPAGNKIYLLSVEKAK